MSVGPAGVITSSWRCSARAERRAAADRAGLLHSLAAAARSVPAKVAERSAGRELADRLCEYTRPQCDIHAALCVWKRTTFSAISSRLPRTSPRRGSTSLRRRRPGGCLSLPFLTKTKKEDSFLLGFRQRNLHMQCARTQHAFRHQGSNLCYTSEQQSRRRALAAGGCSGAGRR